MVCEEPSWTQTEDRVPKECSRGYSQGSIMGAEWVTETPKGQEKK